MNTPGRSPDRYERVFVSAAWMAASVALFAFIHRYGADVPWMDDWELVPVLAHERAPNWRWFWMQQNEHRFPVTKLLFLGLGYLTGGDWRAGMFASAVLLSAIALASILLAARLRGQASYADALLPLLLLHPGHGHNVLGHIQLFFVSACALAMAFTLLVASGRWRTSVGSAAALAACLVLLPLHSAAGALLTPILAAWAVGAGLARRRTVDREGRRAASVLLAGGLGGLVLTALYFKGFVRMPYHPKSPSLTASARGAMEVLAMALGPFGADTWPWSTAALALLCVATVVLLAAAIRVHATERVRALGLLAAAAAVLATVAAMGAGRAGFGVGSGFAARYALPLAPLAVAVYFTWLLYGGTAARFVQMALFTAACAALPLNVKDGLAYGRMRRAQADRLAEAVRAGVPAPILAQQHGPGFYPHTDVFERRLRMLERAGQGPYRHVPRAARPAPCSAWQRRPLNQIGGHHMAWRDGVGRPTGPNPYVIFGLTDAEKLCGIRLTFEHRSANGGESPLKVYWALNAAGAAGWFSEQRTWTATIRSASEPQTVVVWINDDVDLLRFDPAADSTGFRVTGLELLAGT